MRDIPKFEYATRAHWPLLEPGNVAAIRPYAYMEAVMRLGLCGITLLVQKQLGFKEADLV
jgi:hypothetical protein